MEVVGEATVEISCNKQCHSLPLIVVAEQGPTLLGRNWLQYIQLNWRLICALSLDQSPKYKVEALLSKYAEIFRDELGTVHSMKVKLHVKPGNRPKFYKPRSVPFAVKSAIEQELERMESSGILQRVSTSELATPTVSVPKKDGNIRICGDYKVNVNDILDVERYPLPKPQDLFASLAGGQ